MLSSQLIESLKHPAFFVDQNWKVIEPNSLARQWLGMSDSADSIDWDKGLGGTLKPLLTKAWSHDKAEEKVLIGHPNGTLRPTIFSAAQVKGASPSQEAMIFAQVYLISDSTIEELKLETQLSSERVELALRARKVGFFDWNIQSDKLLWDRTQYEIFDVNPSEFTNAYDAWASTLSQESAEAARREVANTIAGKSEYNTEFEVVTKTGEKRIIRGSGVLIRDTNGEPQRLVGLNWDVTQRRMMESQFLEQAFLTRKITDTVPSFIIVGNLNSRSFDFFNSQLFKITDYTDEELRELNFDDISRLIAPQDRPKYSEFLSRIPSLADDEVTEYEFWLTSTRKNIPQCIRIRAQIFERDAFGAPASIIISGNDISEEKKLIQIAEAERAKAFNAAKMAALGEMAGGIAHEINNPLTVIVGKAETLRRYLSTESLGTAQVSESLDRIISTCQRIAKIIRGMRTISRNEESESFQPLPLNTVIDELTILCHQRMVSMGIDFQVGRPPPVVMDLRPVQVSQILLNLLNNAIDAVANLERPWISVSFKETEKQIDIVVTDSGGPIDLMTASRMMQPFFTTKDVGKGTGLGLSISASLAAQHGGHLFHDASSKNTKFVLRLPKFQRN